MHYAFWTKGDCGMSTSSGESRSGGSGCAPPVGRDGIEAARRRLWHLIGGVKAVRTSRGHLVLNVDELIEELEAIDETLAGQPGTS